MTQLFTGPEEVESSTRPKGRCPECGRGYERATFKSGWWLMVHGGSCSQNSANQVCERCGEKHVEMNFGNVLSCILGMSEDEGRDLQRRIVNRLG